MSKRCPACGEEVHAVASRCKHCKADLLAIDAATDADESASSEPGAPPQPVTAARPATEPPARRAGEPSRWAERPVERAGEPSRWAERSVAQAGKPSRAERSVAQAGKPSRAERSAAQAGKPSRAERPVAQAGGWIHRWPLVVIGVALLCIGISIGVLLERWMVANQHTETRRPGSSPHRIPDQLPKPSIPPPAVD